MELYFYKIKELVKVVDADTIDAIVDLGFSTFVNHRFRLAGYDAPETFRPVNERERSGGKVLTAELQRLVSNNVGNLYIKTIRTDADIYARYSAILYYNQDEVLISINDIIKDFMITQHLTKEELRGV